MTKDEFLTKVVALKKDMRAARKELAELQAHITATIQKFHDKGCFIEIQMPSHSYDKVSNLRNELIKLVDAWVHAPEEEPPTKFATDLVDTYISGNIWEGSLTKGDAVVTVTPKQTIEYHHHSLFEAVKDIGRECPCGLPRAQCEYHGAAK